MPVKKKPVKKTISKKTVVKASATKKIKPKKIQSFKQISKECKASIRVGRPTSYRKEFPEMMYDFFNQPATIDKEIFNREGEKVMATVAMPYLSLSSFAVHIGVTSSTIREWASSVDADGQKKHPEFSATYHCCKEMQGANLVTNGASGAYKENFSKFLAINNHGYQERQTQDINVTAVGVQSIDKMADTATASRQYSDMMSNKND